MGSNLTSDNPSKPDRAHRTGRLTYRGRHPDETQEQYLARMTRAHAEMAALMRRTRKPWEYD